MNKDDFSAMAVVFYADGTITLRDVLDCITRFRRKQ